MSETKLASGGEQKVLSEKKVSSHSKNGTSFRHGLIKALNNIWILSTYFPLCWLYSQEDCPHTMARTVSCILAFQQCYQKDSMSISVIPEKALGQILMNRSWPSLGYMTTFSHHSGHQDAFLWLAQPGLSGHFCSSLEGSSSNWITRTKKRVEDGASKGKLRSCCQMNAEGNGC